MSMAKLTTMFKLQAYLGATNSNYKNQVFLVL